MGKILRKWCNKVVDVLRQLSKLRDEHYVDRVYEEIWGDLESFQILKRQYCGIAFLVSNQERKEKAERIENRLRHRAKVLKRKCEFLEVFYKEFLSLGQVSNLRYIDQEMDKFLQASEE